MDHFEYQNGVYHAEDVSLISLAEQIGTPFYCYSTATLERHFRVFSEHFSGLNAKICYATKANSNVAILKTLGKLGAGADVVSEGEIRLALAAGISPQNIVFSGVGKTATEMAFALSHDIFQFNVESEPELELLAQVAAEKNMRARVAIRVNPDVIPETHAKISTGQKESKFGVSMQAARPLFAKAQSLPSIDLQGVSVHIGSQLTKLEPFREAFKRVRTFVEELRASGIPIHTLDLGGGLGIPYGKDEPPLPDAYAEIVNEAVRDLGCQIIFEPGRLIVGNAGILVSRVIYVKHTPTKTFVIVDAAMNDLMRPTLYDAHHDIVPVMENAAAKMEAVDVVGPVCETGDIFAKDRMMAVPKAGDLLVFRSAGAYGAVMAGTYNARPLVPEVLVNGKKFAIIRARQTYEDLIARDLVPEWV